MTPLLLALLLALAAVALLAGVRLFVARPRERPPDYRAALGTDARTALRELLSDPDSVAGREAEQRGDWAAARTAYGRALDGVLRQDAGDPTVALKRRALESKLEELDRLRAEKP
jgi:hypothetical protein